MNFIQSTRTKSLYALVENTKGLLQFIVPCSKADRFEKKDGCGGDSEEDSDWGITKYSFFGKYNGGLEDLTASVSDFLHVLVVLRIFHFKKVVIEFGIRTFAVAHPLHQSLYRDGVDVHADVLVVNQ
jgi:hypothetical protein